MLYRVLPWSQTRKLNCLKASNKIDSGSKIGQDLIMSIESELAQHLDRHFKSIEVERKARRKEDWADFLSNTIFYTALIGVVLYILGLYPVIRSILLWILL
jgi:hypothetical protein